MSEFASVSRVRLVRCPDYDSGRMAEAVDRCLSALEPFPFFPGARILLKPNCLSADHGPDRPVNTRPEVIEAVGRYLVDRYRVKLVLADSGGMGSYGKTRRIYTFMGLEGIARRLEARLVNLEAMDLIDLSHPEGMVLKGFKATSLLAEIDFLVNLPKMKTHLLTGITGSIKNYLGLLPGSLKRAVHVAAPSGPSMAQALVDICKAVNQKVPTVFNLMDGIQAMEGMGPSRGQARQVGLILASKDPVALDTVAAWVMGFVPLRLPLLQAAEKAGLGRARPEAISLIGASWEDLPVPGFRHPFTRTREWVERMVPDRWLGKAYEWLQEAKPRVRKERCQGCGICVQACPAGAMTLIEGGLRIDRRLCIECYCCLEHCPSAGLWVPRGFKDRWWGRS